MMILVETWGAGSRMGEKVKGWGCSSGEGIKGEAEGRVRRKGEHQRGGGSIHREPTLKSRPWAR